MRIQILLGLFAAACAFGLEFLPSFGLAVQGLCLHTVVIHFFRIKVSTLQIFHSCQFDSPGKVDAVLKPPHLLLQKIEAAADKPQHWTAAAWILERKYPDEFGKAERTRDDKTDDVPHISLGVEVKVTNEGDGDV